VEGERGPTPYGRGKGREGEGRGGEKGWERKEVEEGTEWGPQFEKNDPPRHHTAGYGPDLGVFPLE